MGLRPSSRKGAPAGLMRRPQKSELTRSVSFQSGPASSTTTFLPALARTAANVEPEAPEPTMTTSTFSFAMSPPLRRRDMRHVGNVERLVAGHGAVDDIDGVEAQHRIDKAAGRRTLPALDLVLAHIVDEAVLRSGTQFREFLTRVDHLARPVHCAKRGAVEISIWRPHVEDARLKQRLRRRYRNLVVDEMRNAAGTRTRYERFAERFEGCDLLGVERAERDVLGPRLPRCQ